MSSKSSHCKQYSQSSSGKCPTPNDWNAGQEVNIFGEYNWVKGLPGESFQGLDKSLQGLDESLQGLIPNS